MTVPQIGRRAAMGRMALTATAAASAAASARTLGALNKKAPEHTVTVSLDEPIGTIRPALYSQFAEHIGGVIYGPNQRFPTSTAFAAR
jgi:cobalamin biosynthesis protein CbiD